MSDPTREDELRKLIYRALPKTIIGRKRESQEVQTAVEVLIDGLSDIPLTAEDLSGIANNKETNWKRMEKEVCPWIRSVLRAMKTRKEMH